MSLVRKRMEGVSHWNTHALQGTGCRRLHPPQRRMFQAHTQCTRKTLLEMRIPSDTKKARQTEADKPCQGGMASKIQSRSKSTCLSGRAAGTRWRRDTNAPADKGGTSHSLRLQRTLQGMAEVLTTRLRRSGLLDKESTCLTRW